MTDLGRIADGAGRPGCSGSLRPSCCRSFTIVARLKADAERSSGPTSASMRRRPFNGFSPESPTR